MSTQDAQNNQAHSTVDPAEVAHFAKMADTWWDPNGPFKPLHALNPTRISYITRALSQHFGKNADDHDAIKGLSGLDIGCGGGLICEPLSQKGAEMTGVDATEKNIKVASAHAAEVGANVQYRHTTAEALVEEGLKFDFIINMEVLEHVSDINLFLDACHKLLKPNGVMLFSTLNRTAKSYLTAIVGAEYILKWLPKGTHHWQKFIKPSELHSALTHNGFCVDDLKGMSFNPLNNSWSLSSDLSINYLGTATPQKN